MTEWAPTADIDTLHRRAMLMAAIRQFFADRQVLEVDTPVLSAVGVTDVHVHNLRTADGGFLLTSPEYPMKRLLAAGMGDCYQLGHVFRADESGARHNREFTLLEWYRLGWDHHQLMQEVAALCEWVHRAAGGSGSLVSTVLSYQDAFKGAGLPDPHRASLQALQQVTALKRQSQGLPEPQVDERLLAAMQAGLPECAGVALGVDRLLMVMMGKTHIRQVLPFDADRA